MNLWLSGVPEEEEELDAVRESLAEWRAGDPGVPLEVAFDIIRGRHGLGEAR